MTSKTGALNYMAVCFICLKLGKETLKYGSHVCHIVNVLSLPLIPQRNHPRYIQQPGLTFKNHENSSTAGVLAVMELFCILTVSLSMSWL